MDINKEYASKGVAGAGLGTGIAGLSLGVINSLGGLAGLGGMFNNRASACRNDMLSAAVLADFVRGRGAVPCGSDCDPVTQREMRLVQEIAAKDSQIALRDAKIMALQSQINPHFLNNTLEIINWEARLNGNYKVSSMIEALSTMLGATMNRKEAQFHSIAEEMAYADAYLYIIAQRFGTKFQCTKHIDERLMTIQVPRLIIQPIVENAVDHGMDISTKGCLEIRLYERHDGYLCIEVEDNGRLTKEDKDKIDKLLSKDASLTGEKRVSLGIRNVDQRLKMIYGDDCGLFITGSEQENTISTILLKTEMPNEQ